MIVKLVLGEYAECDEVINSQLSLLCQSHVLGVENVLSALLFEESEFPKCHVLHVLLLLPFNTSTNPPFPSLHPSLLSFLPLQFTESLVGG